MSSFILVSREAFFLCCTDGDMETKGHVVIVSTSYQGLRD